MAQGNGPSGRVDNPPLDDLVRLEFFGTGFHLLGWTFVLICGWIVIAVAGMMAISFAAFFNSRFLQSLGLLVVLVGLAPVFYALWTAAIYKWYIGHLSISDGTRASFQAPGDAIWRYFAVIGLAIVVSTYLPYHSALLAVLLVSLGANYAIIRWFIRNISLNTRESMEFQGSVLVYLGFMMLLVVSSLTIVGWAWVAAAFIRWFCRNISMEHRNVTFAGSGWQILWRSILLLAGSLLVGPFPWLGVWFIQWTTRNVVVHGTGPPPTTSRGLRS